MTDLPVAEVLPQLCAALDNPGRAVLQAPPGAGKTTGVPLALLDQPWRAPDRRILVLEPRRLAARAAAARMAALRGESVGGTVGYRIRHDSRVGPDTRIEVVTEGLFLRRLQADPALEDVAAVLFDEFHERHVDSDLALALCLEAASALRHDLRLLIMSATLDAAPVARLLGDAPLVTSTGRLHPVRTLYRPRTPHAPLEADVAGAVGDALAQERGDILVFLPGAAEIRRVGRRLTELPARTQRGDRVRLCPLFGDLAQDAQDDALRPAAAGERKVVLATAIAETSLTIEGVRTVIDAGLMRVPRFDPQSGMTRLETVRVSQASAEQRRGRAGRLGPGVCHRLWPEAEHKALPAFTAPEIRAADLAPLALELAVWGVADAGSLAWLDPPAEAPLSHARALLRALGALDAAGAVTPHGRAMAELGSHPRLAHMMLRGKALGCAGLACALAALLEERDVLAAGPSGRDADLQPRLDLILPARGAGGGPSTAASVGAVPRADPASVKRIRLAASQTRRRLGAAPTEAGPTPEQTGLLVALAYPDRIARRRAGGGPTGSGARYLLANGRGARLDESDSLAAQDWLAVAHLDGDQREARIFLAAPFAPELLETHFADQLETVADIAWDRRDKAVVALRRRRFGAVSLQETALPDPDPDAVAAALLDGIRTEGLACLPWSEERRHWRERIQFLFDLEGPDAGWPDLSDQALLGSLEQWLQPFARGVRRPDALSARTLSAALDAVLSWSLKERLAVQAPSHIAVPSGSRIRIDYGAPDGPVLAVKLQEMFGATETPTVADGRVALQLHLLSPARRPVQVTRDLAGFWRTGYAAVKAELKGRYPKHPWPDDPRAAVPTRRPKPRRPGPAGSGA